MKVLVIKLKHIGDALVTTPAITALRQEHPDASISMLVRKGCEGILSGCPALDRVFTVAASEHGLPRWGRFKDYGALLGKLRAEQFDYAIELGGNDTGRLTAALCRARKRVTNAARPRLPVHFKPAFNHSVYAETKYLHQVERDFTVIRLALGLAADSPGALTFAPERMEAVPDFPLAPGSYAVVHPSTRWARKQWPVERWTAVTREVLDRGLGVVVSTGPSAEEVAIGEHILASCGEGHSIYTTRGRHPFSQLAWMLRHARVFVGVDTAVMHLAAAAGTPVIALFGKTRERTWHPWRVSHEIVSADPIPSDAPFPEYKKRVANREMDAISVDAVMAAFHRIIDQEPMPEALRS